MGFDEGQIVLNSDNGTYYPGQMLSGRLEFTLDKDKKFRGIYADIKGRCKVHWVTHHSRRVNDRTEHYTVSHDSYEEYMNVTIYLIGSKSGEQTLHPGTHVFPFECEIPPNCPSSFEGSEGSVRYSVKVTVDRAFKLDQTKKEMFRVEAPLDLNSNPYCKEPIAFEFDQTFCCWCMNSGNAETIVKLPAGGFCPKQIIPIEVACNNTSSVEIDKIKFSIKKTITFEAAREPDTRSSKDTIAELKKGPIPGNTSRNWTVEMEVPDMDAYNLDSCRYISIDYTFKVDIETSGCHTDEDESRTIYIGTIPLASLQYPPNSNFESVQNKQGVTNYPAPPIINQPLSNYPNGSPFPGANVPYPGNTPNIGFNAENPPYPVVTPYPAPSPFPAPSPYPASSPYPAVTPYPVSPNMGATPYPTGNTGANPPYPTSQLGSSNAPFPPTDSGRTSPYPTNPYATSPNHGTNPPYPIPPNAASKPPYPTPPNLGTNAPYPTSPNVGINPPYPTSPNAGANPPYPPQNTESGLANSSTTPYTPGKPAISSTGLKTGNIGFTGTTKPSESMPLLPPSATPVPPSPFAAASAPPPSTPDDDDKKPGGDIPRYF